MNIKVVLSKKIDIIMIHSKWICNIYEKDFEMKEKRNEYKKRIHHQRILIEIEKQELKRLKKEKFIYKYEKEYITTQSLKWYQRNCKIETFKIKTRNTENDNYKDIFSYLWWIFCMRNIEINDSIIIFCDI